MYCTKCGKEVKQTENFCPSCGTKIIDPDKVETNESTGYQSINDVVDKTVNTVENPRDVPTTGLMILSFIIPVIGIILYCLWSTDFPKKAKCCLKGFIGSIIFYAVLFCCIISVGINQIKEAEFYYDYDNDFFSHVVEVIE